MKKIHIVLTGGTVVMVSKKGVLQPGSATMLKSKIAKAVPELTKIAEVSFGAISNMDSSDIQPKDWQELARYLARNMDKYDGFVVLHGTDTMAYSASALSFMLHNLKKPVILTGSQKPLGQIGTDARHNLINACRFAAMDIPEVCIYFADRLLRGNRTEKLNTSAFIAFDSLGLEPLGISGVDMSISKDVLKNDGVFRLMDRLEKDVAVLKLYPGIKPKLIDDLVSAGMKGIVIEAFGTGNVPTGKNSLVPAIKRAVKSGVVVCLISQCREGKVLKRLYLCGERAHKAGALSGADMTTEAAYTKLMHILAYEKDSGSIKMRFEKSLAGEMNESFQ